jgi:hypothetical protein
MIFKYGSYAHDQDEVMVRTSIQGIFDKFSRRMGDVIEYTIIGVKQVADNADPEVTKANLTAALQALTDAYDEDYQDFGLYHDDGSTPTRHVVENDETFGGVKVVAAPAFLNGPWTGRIEYTNRRTYAIVLRAEIRVGEGQYSWNERLTIRGTGGPKWRYSPTEVGYPQIQTLQTATTFWYVQEGDNVGRLDWEPPADPLFPIIEHGEMRVRTFDSPRDIVPPTLANPLGREMFPTSWKYFMEASLDQGLNPFDLPTINSF